MQDSLHAVILTHSLTHSLSLSLKLSLSLHLSLSRLLTHSLTSSDKGEGEEDHGEEGEVVQLAIDLLGLPLVQTRLSTRRHGRWRSAQTREMERTQTREMERAQTREMEERADTGDGGARRQREGERQGHCMAASTYTHHRKQETSHSSLLEGWLAAHLHCPLSHPPACLPIRLPTHLAACPPT